jgi:hypothetical protein
MKAGLSLPIGSRIIKEAQCLTPCLQNSGTIPTFKPQIINQQQKVSEIVVTQTTTASQTLSTLFGIETTMLKLLTTYCLTFLTSLSFAQTADTFKVSGIVVSANNGEPIPDGVIMVTRTKGYKCDSLGRFTLYNLTSGQHKISFSALGYPSKDTIISITSSDIDHIRWNINTDCWQYSREKASKDIQANKPSVLLQGGIAPIVYTTDKVFERKYNVVFYDFGCVAADSQECLLAYNKTIFEYLDRTFGKKWRKEIRKDAIGLKNK